LVCNGSGLSELYGRITSVRELALSNSSNGKRPTIVRIWRGRTRPERADEYEAYNYEAGIKPLIEKAMGVQTFREDREGDCEFVTISYWESIEAMSRFTGTDATAIHHLERDPEFLIELPERVQVLKIRATHGETAGDPSWRPGSEMVRRS
jgi:heme-degrading monooxygenase HmoA